MRYARQLLAGLVFLTVAVVSASAVEHPGVFLKDAKCDTCHADKMRGKSVHSAMETPCATCHMEADQGDMANLTLAMPRQQICSACHLATAGLKKHTPDARDKCLDCHDAHRSNRRLLLKDRVPDSGMGQKPTRVANLKK